MRLVVFHIFKDSDQRWAKGLQGSGLSWSFPLQCGERPVRPLAIMALIELSKRLRLNVSRDGGTPFRQWPSPALLKRLLHIFKRRGSIPHGLTRGTFDQLAAACRPFIRECFQDQAVCVDPNGPERPPKGRGIFPPIIELVLQPFQGGTCLQRL